MFNDTRVGIVGISLDKIPYYKSAEVPTTVMKLVKWLKVFYDGRVTIISGESPKDGVDKYAKLCAKFEGLDFVPYPPKGNEWKYYKRRNIQMANVVDYMYCITVESSQWCDHCKVFGHIQSGGCWTIKYAAKEEGKKVSLIVV